MVQNKLKDITNFFIGITIMVIALIASYFFYGKFDLTADNRFTLSDNTIELVSDLEDIVEFKIYIKGDHVPADLERIRISIKETLEEISDESDDYIEFEFVNLSEVITDQDKLFKELGRLESIGIRIERLKSINAKGEEDFTYTPLGAEAFYKGKSVPIAFLKGGSKATRNQMFEKAVESIEYEISNAIRRLKNENPKKIGLLQGHGELHPKQVQDLAKGLLEYYLVAPVALSGPQGEVLSALDQLDVLLIAKPELRFTQKEQYIVDQFIMKGGKVLWMMEGTKGAELDSLLNGPIMFVGPQETQLNPLLFKYGIKLNTDLVEDLQCSKIPLQSTTSKSPGQIELKPWVYTPLSPSDSSHLITRNLDPIRFEFASTIDTIPTPEVKHTILYSTSGKNRYKKTPTRIGFREAAEGFNVDLFKSKKKPLVVLSEGKFSSYFKNRMAPEFAQNPDAKFKPESEHNKMIVISDGDIGRNWFDSRSEQAIPLGTDKILNYNFDNKKLIMNCINYLTGDENMISVRSKSVNMRQLDDKKIKNNKVMIQTLNVVIPSAIILLIAFVFFLIRKMKFA